jgi:hypothetical protein
MMNFSTCIFSVRKTKKEICWDIFIDNYKTSTKEEVIDMFINQGKMTYKGAQTYYSGFKKYINL